MSMARLHSSFQWNNKAEQAFHCGRSSEERRTPKVQINDDGLM